MSIEIRALVNCQTEEVIGRVVFRLGVPKKQNKLVCTITNQETGETSEVLSFISNAKKYIDQINNPLHFMNDNALSGYVSNDETSFAVSIK